MIDPPPAPPYCIYLLKLKKLQTYVDHTLYRAGQNLSGQQCQGGRWKGGGTGIGITSMSAAAHGH